MIVSASYKTDIPAFYGAWFQARLAEGHCQVANPYGGKPFSVRLDPEYAEGFVFWTRNAAPFQYCLDQLGAERRPFVVQFTITGYPRSLDVSTIDPAQAIEELTRLSNQFGGRVGVWRYDPIVFTDVTPADWHVANFTELASRLDGVVDEVAISFAQIYKKTRRNLDAVRRQHGINWRDPSVEEKHKLLLDLATIAARYKIRLTICGQPDLANGDVGEARCIDGGRLADIAGGEIAHTAKPHRAKCLCHQSRDIGAYDSCPHGCAYCYAVRDRTVAKARQAQHDPGNAFLIPLSEPRED
jgi:hypothetical protein